MALVFPTNPSIGDLYPVDPGISGVTQYRYDGEKWSTVTPMVSLGVENQGAYNTYQWPMNDGLSGQQLTTDGAGNLTWGVAAAPTLQILGLLEPFNGSNITFTFTTDPGSVPFTPTPSSNVVVFLGGVPQLPGIAFTVSGNTLTFTDPPLAGTTFYAISSVVS